MPGASPAPTAPVRRKKRPFLCWSSLLALLGLVWFQRAAILTAAGGLLVIDDPLPTRADAIVVLGGGMAHRPQEAARLYRLGLAPRILVTHPTNRPGLEPNLIPSEGELATTLLERLGVPRDAITAIGPGVASTHDEAGATHQWIAAHSSQHIIVPTDIFHTRRVKWTFENALRDKDVKVTVTVVPNHRYTTANWWHWPDGLMAYQNEVLKLLFYWASYR
jgi:uncharacterized SAM-binding protein YcdF (DUF218 family)